MNSRCVMVTRVLKTVLIKSLVLGVAAGCLSLAPAQAQAPAAAPANPVNVEAEKAAIRQVIMDAYVEGIFITADPEAVRKGWHPDCDIVTTQGGNLVKTPAHNFVRRFERNRTPLDANARAEFTSITVSGYAAVAVLELKSGKRPVYTDMMSLYKFDDGWKIVTKVFYTYPAPAPGR